MSPPRVQSGLIGADALRSPGLWIRVSEVCAQESREAAGGAARWGAAARRPPPRRRGAVRRRTAPIVRPSTPPQAVLATLVWALVADNAGYSYAIFLGVTTGVLCALCVASELRHWGTWLPRRAVLALDCIYWILW